MAKKVKEEVEEKVVVKKEKDKVMDSLFSDIMKISGNQYASVVSNGTIGDVLEYYDTGAYMLNMQMSGSIFGGIANSQIVTYGGSSGVGKTFFALSAIESFQQMHKEGIVVYFDSENALNKSRIGSRKIDMNRIMHFPVMSLPELKTQWVRIVDKLNTDVKPGSKKFLYVVDSIGNLPSNKELVDAIEGKSVVDFTRAKEIKSIFRLITPKLSIHGSSAITVAHTYTQTGFIAMEVMGGGGGQIYNSDVIMMLTKAQHKEGDKVMGNIIKSKCDKNRDVRCKTKIELLLHFEKGLHRYYGMLPWMEETGIAKKNGKKYTINGVDYSEKEIYGSKKLEVFTPELLKEFDQKVSKFFKFGSDDLFDSEDDELDSIIESDSGDSEEELDEDSL